jgi:hypothetical protein
MIKHNINLNTLLSKGHITTKIQDEMLHVTTTQRIHESFDKENISINSYTYLPDAYKLPLRIDLTIKIDSPGLYLLLGNGHINFGTPWSDNRRIADIIQPNLKPNFFHNHIPMNEFVYISVIYDFKAMQILVNNEERFYSVKEKYMKSELLKDFNDAGFKLKIACTKRADLVIKSLSITEFDGSADITHMNIPLPNPLIINTAITAGQKPELKTCISLLPKDIQNEINKIDTFLRSLKPMKFKRQVEKHGHKITYLASEYGFSYAIHPSNDVLRHSLNWYVITSGKPELWHRKADLMEVTLAKLAETSPEFAERMFLNLAECVGCCQCMAKTPYIFKDKKKLTCHGRMEFKMCAADFDDVRTFINTINKLLSES